MASSSGSRAPGRARGRLLLLDEITSALDPELVGEVLAIVRDLAASGVTILMATHEMGFARQVADTVCFLDGGRVLESGPPAQVLGRPGAGAHAPVPRPPRGGRPPGVVSGGAGAAPRTGHVTVSAKTVTRAPSSGPAVVPGESACWYAPTWKRTGAPAKAAGSGAVASGASPS